MKDALGHILIDKWQNILIVGHLIHFLFQENGKIVYLNFRNFWSFELSADKVSRECKTVFITEMGQRFIELLHLICPFHTSRHLSWAHWFSYYRSGWSMKTFLAGTMKWVKSFPAFHWDKDKVWQSMLEAAGEGEWVLLQCHLQKLDEKLEQLCEGDVERCTDFRLWHINISASQFLYCKMVSKWLMNPQKAWEQISADLF